MEKSELNISFQPPLDVHQEYHQQSLLQEFNIYYSLLLIFSIIVLYQVLLSKLFVPLHRPIKYQNQYSKLKYILFARVNFTTAFF